MKDMKERPICHRAEDLVSYLYGEASADEARDFAEHMQRCESCKAEFASFSQVHESIMLWRNEALGSVSMPPVSPLASEVVANQFEQRYRTRSARTALREFFAISPLWLRGATALATLLLFALALFAVSRMWTRTPQITANNPEKIYSPDEFHNAVNKEVETRMNAFKNAQADATRAAAEITPPGVALPPKTARTKVARSPRVRLTPQERQQLAADLRLIPGADDNLPFVFSDEPE